MALRLTIPSINGNFTPPAEIRPKQLKEKLESLPLTRLFESTRSVCDELAKLNRSKLPADDRLKLLEIYDPVLKQLAMEIAEDYNKAPLPLPANSRRAVNIVRELLIEQAYAYKLILLEKTNKLMLFGAAKQLIPLIEKLIEIFSNALVLAYQSYLPTPAGVWQELHELYRYAFQQKLIEDEINANRVSTIDMAYKSALLVALIDPYRLPRPDLRQVMQVVKHLAPLVVLNLRPPVGIQSLFVIFPDTDKPPKPASQMQMDENTNISEWAIGTSYLIEHLSSVINKLESQPNGVNTKNLGALGNFPVDILKRLYQTWGVPHKRSYSRHNGQAVVQVCIGINRICRLLHAASAKDAVGDVSEILNQASEPLHEWDIVNQSAGGFKLRGMPSQNVSINVGEPLVLRYRGGNGGSIGVIRWAQTFEDSSVELGVQMLAPSAQVVTLTPTIGAHHPQNGLLLPEIAALQQPAAILLGTGNYIPSREFVLTQDVQQIRTIRASALIEKTNSFELFHFLPA